LAGAKVTVLSLGSKGSNILLGCLSLLVLPYFSTTHLCSHLSVNNCSSTCTAALVGGRSSRSEWLYDSSYHT